MLDNICEKSIPVHIFLNKKNYEIESLHLKKIQNGLKEIL